MIKIFNLNYGKALKIILVRNTNGKKLFSGPQSQEQNDQENYARY